ncbi:competence protein CoiA [Bacillus pinisoli]|uniref:competence protein CoiA n=1 Tax=Bacillus pinisoli TaxID=2901866 RepID=UPI001FF4BA8F
MLVAQNHNGQLISITKDWTKESLFNLRNQEEFHCPGCKEPVMLRVGDQRIPHFAHVRSSQCHSFSEPESSYHLSGKLQLYEWLQNQSLYPVLEPYIHYIKQRPDLYLSIKSASYAIEYQCSTISFKQFKERTEGYVSKQIKPLWILGGKRLKRYGPGEFSLSAFDWMFVQLGSNHKPYLLSYCSEIRKFLFLHHIIPLSSTKALGDLDIICPADLTFRNLVSHHKDPNSSIQQWIDIKKNWRLHCTRYPSQSMKKLLHFLYQKQVYPSLLPSEIGIPIRSMYWIQTSPFVWQSWILLEFIEQRPIGDVFTFQSLYEYFNLKRKTEPLFIRDLPLITTSHYSFALMEYLQSLVQVGLLERVNTKTFKRITRCQYPKNIEEALEFDERLFTKHKKLLM